MVNVINDLIKPDPPDANIHRGVRDLEFWDLCPTSQLIIPFVFFLFVLFFCLKALINNLWARITSFGSSAVTSACTGLSN